MELLSSRMGSGDPMAADKGFAACSLLTPEDEERRRAVAAFFAGAAGAACTAAAELGGALDVATSADFPACLTAAFLCVVPDGVLSGAAAVFSDVAFWGAVF
ncbi:MAG: hypothetical protein ACP5RV_00545 [Thiomonas sp.]